MNALVRKEIRLILPAWIAALVLAICPVWLLWPGQHGLILPNPGFLVYAPFGVGVLLLGLSSFGQELNYGTFSTLLAQPVSRRSLWLAKTRVLGAALALVFAAAFLSVHFRAEAVIEQLKTTDWHKLWDSPVTELQMRGVVRDTRLGVLHDLIVIGGLCTLAAFAGGLWTNLLFRNTSAAFWFALLVPFGLGLLADKLFSGFILGDAGLILVLGIYSAAGFLWAKKFFLRVQDTQWTGGLLSMPPFLGATAESDLQNSARRARPWAALLRKEIQLHQVNLFIAILLLLAHVVVILVRRVGFEYFQQHRSAAMIWEAWPLLWLAMPVLIGGVAVAEERKLGTLEEFLCLPATRRREFAVKFLTALALGCLLGGLVPLLVEWGGTLIGLPGNVFDVAMSFNWKLVSLASELMIGALGLSALSFLASTLTRNLLQAMGLSVVLSVFALVVTGLAMSAGGYNSSVTYHLWETKLIGLIGWPVMASTIVALAYRNFTELNPAGAAWWRSLKVIFAALFLTALATTLIYNRVWELWMPNEPANGYQFNAEFFRPEKGNQPEEVIHAKMESSRARIAIVLPRGRLWLSRRPVSVQPVLVDGWTQEVVRTTGPWYGGFAEGNNWRQAAVTLRAAYAIQTDGSLWDFSEVQPGENAFGSKPRRVGQDSDWKDICSTENFDHFLGLKNDGSLWAWGTTFVESNRPALPVMTRVPVRVGKDNDWIAIADSPATSLAVKADGSVWRWRYLPDWTTNLHRVDILAELPQRWISLGTNRPVTLSFNGYWLAAICQNGSLWLGRDITDNATYAKIGTKVERVGLGMIWQEARWLEYDGLAATSRNGLWVWDSRRWFSTQDEMWFAPTLKSEFFDWVAVSPLGGGFLALKADGNLCFWANPREGNEGFWSWSNENNFLLPSRIKAKSIARLFR